MKSKWIHLFLLSPVAILLLLLSARLSTVGGATPAIQAGYLPTPRPYEVCDVCEPNGKLSQACGPLDPDHSYQFPIRCAAQPSDDDWYYIDLETPATVTLTLTNILTGTDYDIYLYDGNRQILCSSNNYGPGPEYVVCDLSQGGRYYVRVYPYEGCDDDNLYTLAVDYPPPAPTPIPTATPTPPCNVHIDDFEDSNPDNDLGGASDWEVDPPGCGAFDVNYTSADLKFNYVLTSSECTARYTTDLLGLSAPPNYGLLTLTIKGNNLEELRHTTIGLRDEQGGEARVKVGDFLSRVLTDTWQGVNLPLAAFTTVDASQLDTFFVELTHAQKISGTLHSVPITMYLDNLRLEQPHAPLIVDNFNDQTDPNALGGEYRGDSSHLTPAIITATYTTEDTFDNSPASYVISYSVPAGTWAMWETDLWETYLQGPDVSDYAFLAFAIKGAEGGEKVNLYIQDTTDKRDYVDLETYAPITTDWTLVRVPLQAFGGVDFTRLNKIKFTFEWDPMAGTIFLDDLRFVADTLLIDNFCDQDGNNSLNGEMGMFTSDPLSNTVSATPTLSSGVLRLDYDVTAKPDGYAGYYSRMLLDLNPYRSLKIKVRGERCGQVAAISTDTNLVESNKLKPADYLLDGITDQWQEVRIPLAASALVTGWTQSKSYAIAFEAYRGASKGATWWDDVAYGADCVPLWVDNFNDEDDLNALRDAHYVFKSEGAEITASFSIAQAHGDAGAGLALTYNIPQGEYAGWTSHLRGVDLSGYDQLVFDIEGAAGDETPNIYLEDGYGQRHFVNLEDYAVLSAKWQTVVIPLENFGGLDPTDIQSIQAVFEYASTDIEGALFLDNIRFLCSTHLTFLPLVINSPSALTSVWGGFENDKEGWTYQTYPDSQAVVTVMTSTLQSRQGNASLAMIVDLIGGDDHKSQGEAFVDLTQHPPAGVSAPLDLECKPLTCWVYVPTCGLGDPNAPNWVQLFVKDADGRAEYGPGTKVIRNQWFEIEMRPSILEPDGGWMVPGFNPSAITQVGIKFVEGSQKTTYRGKIYIDACGWQEINGSTYAFAAETCWPDRDTE